MREPHRRRAALEGDGAAGAFGAPAPNVSLVNGGGIRNDEIVPAGPITRLKTFDMLPFGNFVAIVPDVSRAFRF